MIRRRRVLVGNLTSVVQECIYDCLEYDLEGFIFIRQIVQS